MLISFLYAILGIIIGMFVLILGGLGWVFPTSISDAVVTFLSVLHTFSSFLPFISVMVSIAILIVPSYVIRYVFDMVLWVWSLVPWIGTRTTIPAGASIQTSTKRNFWSKKWESKTTITGGKRRFHKW